MIRSPILLTAALVAGLWSMATIAVATGSVTDLGKPMEIESTSPYFPLGGFHRAGSVLRQHGKPELLFIRTMIDGTSAAERWPVVKALDQFGTLSGVLATTTRYCQSRYPQQINCSTPPYPDWRGFATFDCSHARYRSPYLVFVHKDLIDRDLQMKERLSLQELALFNRYVRPSGLRSWHEAVWQTAVNGTGSHQFPLVSIGGYLQTGTDIALPGDLATIATVNLPFAVIQQSLQRAKPVGGAVSTLVPDFNAEANTITALICHADGRHPTTVCGRPAIRAILRHIR